MAIERSQCGGGQARQSDLIIVSELPNGEFHYGNLVEALFRCSQPPYL